jgi:hypothetical protein
MASREIAAPCATLAFREQSKVTVFHLLRGCGFWAFAAAPIVKIAPFGGDFRAPRGEIL